MSRTSSTRPTPQGRVFPLLALLYAGADVQKTIYHVDHIFPQSRFTKAKLANDPNVHDNGDPILYGAL